jgi:sterol desaturase/sphingolipid hydroxylase (fatty acid hydroxylase superfamily)
MTFSSLLETSATTIAAILGAMALIALLEVVIPLHARGTPHRAHARPNLALTCITFVTNIALNGALMFLLSALEASGLGVLRWIGLTPLWAAPIGIVVLDLSFYVAHVAMHEVPAFWRVHRVHHSDVVVDVTTTIRQHPLEGVLRYAFMATFACVFGVGIGPFVVYRTWSALNGLLEHANIRVPRWLGEALSLVTTWPNMHKVHHSRVVAESRTNYGNIFSWFDRLFGTYTPQARGETVSCGVDGLDAPSAQTTLGLLALPFESTPTRERPVDESAPAPESARDTRAPAR